MEEIVNVTWEGQPCKVVMGEITWEQKKLAIKNSIKEVQRGRSYKKESDPILQKELMMLASMKEAPFEKNLESLNKLSSKDGEKLYAVYTKLNEYDEDDAEGEA